MTPAVALLVLSTATLAAEPTLRREATLDFPADEAFQAGGGVQFFYAFATPDELRDPAPSSPLARLRALDDRARDGEALFVVMSRLVYTLERDVSFFTAARARDVTYINAVAPEVQARVDEAGVFHTPLMPANRFTIAWQQPVPDDSPLFAFLPDGARPDSIVVQRNADFARVLGFRTAERSVTWTAHVPLGAGRTRVFVCTMSLLHNVPPPFMGGRQRVYDEAIDQAARLIGRLRAYRGP